jgi:ComF family protein
MLKSARKYLNDFSHLLFPHHCEGCGNDVVSEHQMLCAECLHKLPKTGYFNKPNNSVERKFSGRLSFTAAASAYYFTKDSLLQHLIFELKYRGNKNIGQYLGRIVGHQLLKTERFDSVDIIVPLPLNPKREFTRGYNQALVICEGISSVWQKPIAKKLITRTIFTETQTHQDRIHRWQNMDGVFKVTDMQTLHNKHVLLIDDVVTTGATLEACGNALLAAGASQLSFVTVATTG